jgi:hypothetical protein
MAGATGSGSGPPIAWANCNLNKKKVAVPIQDKTPADLFELAKSVQQLENIVRAQDQERWRTYLLGSSG